MSVKATFILIAVFALCFLAFLLTRGQADPSATTPREDTAQQDQSTPLLAPSSLSHTLQRIRFDFGEDGVRLELARRNGRWRVVKPHDFPANTAAVDEVMNRLGNLTGKQIDDNARQAGDTAAVELVHDDDTVRLELGPRLGNSRASITRLSHGQTSRFEAKDDLHELFDYFDTTLFFSNKLDSPLMLETERVEILTADQQVLLSQSGGRWLLGQGNQAERALEKPIPGYASVEDYFTLASTVEILKHHVYEASGGLSRFGLEQPLIEVRFSQRKLDESSDMSSTTLRVGVPADPQDQTRFVSYGQSGDPAPAVFVIPTPLALAFAQSGSTFRDPRLITTPITLIGSIDIDMAGEPTQTLSIDPDGATLLKKMDGTTVELDKRSCIQMLAGLIDTRSIQHIAIAELHTLPIATIRFYDRLSRDDETITVYADPSSNEQEQTFLARRGEEAIALRVPGVYLSTLLEAERLKPTP